MIQPYFEDDSVTIYLGDCRDVLPVLPEPADLLLTDPPYGMDYESGRRRGEGLGKIAGDDGSLDVPAALTLACRKLKRGRHAYVFGGFDLSETPLTAAVELIWHKEGKLGMGDLKQPWGLTHEPVTFAVYEPSAANRERGYGRLAARLRKGSVLSAPRPVNGSSKATNPAEKPVSILREMIESSSCLGELVLDPFMGSGSTLEAARLEGRRAIGIEEDERECERAALRLGGQGQMCLAASGKER
jgi:site-specific DNA-methyltransferase (adenine-specific)